MRIAVALIPVLVFVAWQPASAQAPPDHRVSSLMPMPRVAQYPTTASTPAWWSAYGTAAAGRGNTGYQAATGPQNRYWDYSNHGAPSRSYPAATRAPQAGYQYSYASQSQTHPQPEPVPARGGPGAATANGNNPYCDGQGSHSYGGDAYGQGASGYGNYGYGGYAGADDYAGCVPLMAGPICPRWCAGAYAMFMDRVDNNPQWFSFDTNDDRNQLFKTTNDWTAGFGVNVARTFGCCQYAVQGVYWGLFRNPSESNLYDTHMIGALNSVYDFEPLDYDRPPATNVNDMFDGARRHRLRQSWEAHNVEINFLGGSLLGHGIGACGGCGGGGYGGAFHGGGAYGGACGSGGCGGGGCCGSGGCGPGLNVGWLFGLRYLYFNDSLQFASDLANRTFSLDANEMFYDIDVDNHLIGLQLGFGADWCMAQWLELRSGMKFGLYNNHINHMSRIYGVNGAAYVDGGANDGMAFDVRSSENEVAFLAELDLGLAVHFTPRLVGTVGYRVVAVNNVGVSTDQIPRNFAGIQDVEDIDSNSSLILHGAYVGAEFCF